MTAMTSNDNFEIIIRLLLSKLLYRTFIFRNFINKSPLNRILRFFNINI